MRSTKMTTDLNIDAPVDTSADPITESYAEYRTRMNLSRREAAELSGLTQSRIWKIEHDDQRLFSVDLNIDAVKYWDALVGFEGDNPDGKPKAAKKAAAAPKVVQGLDTKTVEATLSDLHHIIMGEIDAAKVKKASTKGLIKILDAVDNAVISFGLQVSE
jgi:transcriptional regulator with XRE-family HTH domain